MIGDKDRNSCFSNSALQMLMAFDEFRLVSFKIQAFFISINKVSQLNDCTFMLQLISKSII